jgi:hypothetical protein
MYWEQEGLAPSGAQLFLFLCTFTGIFYHIYKTVKGNHVMIDEMNVAYELPRSSIFP